VPEGSRILLGGSTLFSDGGPNPRPLAKAGVALERLRTLGEPVVLVGRELGGRLLPDDDSDRVAWVRASLDVPWLRIVAFEESGAGRSTDSAADQVVERWTRLRSTWHAETLLTSFESSVGAARRAGLAVIRIGARGPRPDPTVPRADYEASDLLDAVRHLIVQATFGEPAAEPRLDPAASGGGGPSTASGPDVLQGGQPSER